MRTLSIRLGKVFFCLSSIYYSSLIATAQTKTHTLEIGNKATILSICKVRDSGFVLITGRNQKYGYVPNFKTNDFALSHFDKNLNHLWTYHPKDKENEDFFVSSRYTELIYWMSYRNEPISGGMYSGMYLAKQQRNKVVSMVRFQKNGESENIKLKISELYDNVDLLAACSDSSNLYIISQRCPNYDNPLKNPPVPQVFIYKMGHNEKTLTKVKTKLSFSNVGALNFIGVSNGIIYLSQQKMVNKSKLEIEIYKISSDGELISSFVIQPKIKGYFKPHYHKRDLNGTYLKENGDVFKGSSYNLYNENRFGEIKINFENEELYFSAFAVTNEDCVESVCIDAKISGYLFESYDLDGEPKKSYQKSIEDLLISEKEYSKWILQSNSYLSFLDEKSLRLMMSGYHTTANLTLNQQKIESKSIQRRQKKFDIKLEGESHRYPINEYFYNLYANSNYAPESFVEYIQSVKDKNTRSKMHLAVALGRTYVLLKLNCKTNQIELMLFD